ncbi:MAG: DNA-methyltransferase [Candidatus Heimdallarchaeaceae archaeon]
MESIEVGNGKIFIGNAKEILPKVTNKNNAVIITDPPYNIGIKYDNYQDKLPDEEYIDLFKIFKGYKAAIIQYPEETVKYIVPALGVPNKYLAWCYNSNISRQFRLISLYNIKPKFGNVRLPYKNPTDKRIRKLIENGSKGRKSYDWFSDIQLVKNVSKEKVIEKGEKMKPIHPCQIPIKLMQRLIALTSTKKDIIIDPFVGVGATIIAAESMGRKWIGIDLSEKYCKIAVERVRKWEDYVDLKFLENLYY